MGIIASFDFQGNLINERYVVDNADEWLEGLTDKFATLVADKVANVIETRGGEFIEKKACNSNGDSDGGCTPGRTGGRKLQAKTC